MVRVWQIGKIVFAQVNEGTSNWLIIHEGEAKN